MELRKYYYEIPLEAASEDVFPYWNNGFMGNLDAISLYYMTVRLNPRYYVECGSGNSTKFVHKAIRDHNLRTRIISIDPCPRAEIDQLCHELYRCPLEDVDLEMFRILTKEDNFIFDGSHRSFTNSDVTVFMTEVLPLFPAGLTYAIHDICLPDDYSEQWVSQEQRHYNEQYILAAYLLGGAMGDFIEMPLHFLSSLPEVRDILAPVIGPGSQLQHSIAGAGFFWMSKVGSYASV
ncbi:hypothetical protein C4J81_19295 (plasmid) [Deltaproteobacteria bacterium Smac51]|nr:hypothetical protein C4J81_19295 [Deltaproteobacteria bacterium Smac51]